MYSDGLSVSARVAEMQTLHNIAAIIEVGVLCCIQKGKVNARYLGWE